VQCAECREHKRWIERENARLRAKAKKDETKRIRDFVDRAYAADPRVAAHKAAVKAQRDRKKIERQAAAQARADEEKARAEAAQAEAVVAEAAAREAADVARKAKCALLRCAAEACPLHVQSMRSPILRWPNVLVAVGLMPTWRARCSA
jgi:DnaJ homolog subfamily C member 2